MPVAAPDIKRGPGNPEKVVSPRPPDEKRNKPLGLKEKVIAFVIPRKPDDLASSDPDAVVTMLVGNKTESADNGHGNNLAGQITSELGVSSVPTKEDIKASVPTEPVTKEKTTDLAAEEVNNAELPPEQRNLLERAKTTAGQIKDVFTLEYTKNLLRVVKHNPMLVAALAAGGIGLAANAAGLEGITADVIGKISIAVGMGAGFADHKIVTHRLEKILGQTMNENPGKTTKILGIVGKAGDFAVGASAGIILQFDLDHAPAIPGAVGQAIPIVDEPFFAAFSQFAKLLPKLAVSSAPLAQAV